MCGESELGGGGGWSEQWGREASWRAREGQGVLGVWVGWCLEGLAVHCFGNAESSVLSAWLMWLQTVRCRVPRGQGEVKCFPPIEQFQERAAAATVAGGRLGRSAWPARMERKGREETERRNEKLSACSPEERQALVVPPVTLG